MSLQPDWPAVQEAVSTQNKERGAQLRQIRKLNICGWAACVSIAGVGLWISILRSDPEIFFAALFSALLVLAPFSMGIAAKQRRLQTGAYIAILPLLLPGLENWSIVTRKPAPQIARMPGHYFVPRDKIDCDFHIEGLLGGVPFSVTQAVLTRASGEDDGERTFCGLILWTRASTAFPGDFAALRRPPQQRSHWRGTVLPDRLIQIPNTTDVGRWAYDFVSTDPECATMRLPAMARIVHRLQTLRLTDLPQVAMRGSDIFVLLPSERFGWDGERPVKDLDLERHIHPFAARLAKVIARVDELRGL